MILLAFLSCLLVFFFVKDQIASFQLKQIIVCDETRHKSESSPTTTPSIDKLEKTRI